MTLVLDVYHFLTFLAWLDPQACRLYLNYYRRSRYVIRVTDIRSNLIGAELLYAGMPITDVFKENIGIGGVIGLLW
jgi:hypothetical protein